MKLSLLLNNPVIWEFSRIALDTAFGLYRKRIQLVQKYGLLKNNPSVIDIGCGIGQYSTITEGKYLGVDMNKRYINYAHKRHRRSNQSFRCTDVTTVLDEQSRFDLVLMADFLHHISDRQCVNLLNISSHLAKQYVINFEPITEQSNPVGRWIVEHDRGNYVRPLDKLHQLYEESQLELVESIPLMLGPISSRVIVARPLKLDNTEFVVQ